MKKQLLIMLLILLGFRSMAQWSNITATNNLVCGSSPATGKFGNVATSDGAGGMIIAWIDSRDSASKSIYAQRILPDGSLKFSKEVVISNATGDSSSYKANVVIVSDSAGGAIIAWQDARNIGHGITNTDLYGQRIDGNGNILWTKNGVRLSLQGNAQSNKISALPVMASKTEFIFVFGDNRLGTSDLYAQKVSVKDGSLLWATDVSLHGAQPSVQTQPVALSDGKGGAFIVWQDPRVASNNADIYGQYIDKSGNIAWGASGLGICTAKNQQLTPQIVSDNAGGIIVTWSDQRATVADGNIYAQRVNADGVTQWTADGVLVCDFTGNQTIPSIVKGGNGYIIVWSDGRKGTTDRNIYAQSIDNTGTPLWTAAVAGGVPVCTPMGQQPYNNTVSGLKILPDGSNGAYIIWDDSRLTSKNVDIYAQRIDSKGIVVSGWAADGNVVCNALGNQQASNVVLDASNNVIIAWRDSRDSLNTIYASKLSLTGVLVLPVSFTQISSSFANGAVLVKWKVANELNIQTYQVEHSADGINYSPIGLVKANNSAAYSYLDNNSLSGTNFYRILSIENNGGSKYSAITSLSLNSNILPTVSSYPNPVFNALSLSFTNCPKSIYTIKLITTAGQIVSTQQINVDETVLTQRIETTKLATGSSYLLQISNKTGSVLLNKLIIKQ